MNDYAYGEARALMYPTLASSSWLPAPTSQQDASTGGGSDQSLAVTSTSAPPVAGGNDSVAVATPTTATTGHDNPNPNPHTHVPIQQQQQPPHSKGPSERELKSLRRIWFIFTVAVTSVAAVVALALFWALQVQWEVQRRAARHRAQAELDGYRALDVATSVDNDNPAFYVFCVVAGLLSAIPSLIVTPIDVVKCRIQAGVYPSLVRGLQMFFADAAADARAAHARVINTCSSNHSSSNPISNNNTCSSGAGGNSHASITSSSPPPSHQQQSSTAIVSHWTRLRAALAMATEFLDAVFVGWQPIAAGYGTQGAVKYGVYELGKYHLAGLFPAEFVVQHHLVIFLMAATMAEIAADFGLAPWEAMKIRLQTTPKRFHFKHSLPILWRTEGPRGLYQCLIPVMCRQVPVTTIKFVSFEKIARLLYSSGIAKHLTGVQVAFTAGCSAGIICATLSHPADSLVTRVAQLRAAGKENTPLAAVVRQLWGRAMWSGIGPRLLMVALMSAMQWMIYDGFKHAVGLPTSGK